MTHCFIHPTEALYELLRTPLSVPKSFAVDMRHLATLHSVWFRSDAKYRLKWPEAVLSPAEIDAARRSVAQARSAVRKVTVQDADGNAAVPGPNANAMHRGTPTTSPWCCRHPSNGVWADGVPETG